MKKAGAVASSKSQEVHVNDATLREQFETLTLPFEDWTHEAHVRMAWIYLAQMPFADALAEIERRIRAYNAHNDVPESPTQGYNQTTTHAFLQIIDTVRRAYEDTWPADDSRVFYEQHPQFWSSKLLRCFYSPGRWMDPRGKTEFVEPDLAPLPRLTA